VFTHEIAERDNYIRHVEFVEETLPDNSQAFVDRVLDFYDSTVREKKPSGVHTPRVIIRCETENSVSQICRALKLRGKTVLGIHDRFDNEEVEGKAHKVPDPKKRTETFWVHQFKLLEGIDEPDFCFLAIYEPLKNARSLVQQVGRIIRNTQRHPSLHSSSVGLVMVKRHTGKATVSTRASSKNRRAATKSVKSSMFSLNCKWNTNITTETTVNVSKSTKVISTRAFFTNLVPWFLRHRPG
jgi:superfamily II DNA or RNA helicase